MRIQLGIPGSYFFRGPSDQTVGPSVSVAIENCPPSGRPSLGYFGGPLEQYGPLNNIPLVSVVKYTHGPEVWPDGPQNKYDPAFKFLYPSKHSEQEQLPMYYMPELSPQ